MNFSLRHTSGADEAPLENPLVYVWKTNTKIYIYIHVDPTEPGPDHERDLLKWRASRAENGASLALLLLLA